MQSHPKLQAVRFYSARHIMGLSVAECASAVGRSAATIRAIEVGMQGSTTEVYQAMIDLAQKHNILIDLNWLKGKSDGNRPTSADREIQKRIEIEAQIEAYWLLDPALNAFGVRLETFITQMEMTLFSFSRWCSISMRTVHHWLKGYSKPKRCTLRFMINQVLADDIPLSPQWLCTGNGALFLGKNKKALPESIMRVFCLVSLIKRIVWRQP